MPCYGLLGITLCIPSLDEIVNSVLAPVGSLIMDGLNGVINTLTPLFVGVQNTLSSVFQTIADGLSSGLSFLISGVQSVAGSIWSVVQTLPSAILSTVESFVGYLWDNIVGLGDYLASGIQFLGASLAEGVNSLGASLSAGVSSISATVSSGLSTLGSEITSAVYSAGEGLNVLFTAAFNEVGSVLGGVFTGFGSLDLGRAGTDVLTVGAMVQTSLMSGVLRHSPLTPSEAAFEVGNLRVQQRDAYYAAYLAALGIEAASLGQVDGPAQMIFKSPDVAAGISLAESWYAAPYEIGWKPLLERHYLSIFEPLLPPYMDLIGIYVKEGYLEDHWVELPAEMVQNFRELGFSEYWTKRLWGKHWDYPSPTQLYEMLHRTAGNYPEIGVTTDVLRDMLKLHDFEPKWRAPLEAISWNTWRIYDIRTGWEMDLLDYEALERRLVDTGYEPRDATLLAEVQKMFVLRSEIDGLLSEADTDFMQGWIDELTLRANYDATPYRPEIRELRVQRALAKRDRAIKTDLKNALIDRFKKGDISESEFAEGLSRLGITEDWVQTEIERATAYKLTKVKEETTTVAKALTEAKYSRAFKVGLLTEDQYRAALESLKYASEDVDLLVELNTPEKPHPDEIKTLTVGELKSAFRVGVLSETELRNELEARRYPAADIETLVETEKAKLKPTE